MQWTCTSLCRHTATARPTRVRAPIALLGRAPSRQALQGVPAYRPRGQRCRLRAVDEKKVEEDKKSSSDDVPDTLRTSESQAETSSDATGPSSSGADKTGADGEKKKGKNLDVDKVERILRGLQGNMEAERKAVGGKRFVELLVSLGGFKGTLAVIIAKLLNIDPFGNLHWDPQDVAVGIALILPILVIDALLMLPEYPSNPRAASNPLKPGSKVEVETPEALRETLEELKKVAKPMSLTERLSSAAGYFQRLRITQNVGNGLEYWQEGSVVVVAHLADEMLGRAVILGGLGLWVRDRLVEGDLDYAQAQALSPWVALGTLVFFEILRKQRVLRNKVPTVGAAKVEKDKITGKQKVTLLTDEDLLKVPDSPKERERAVRMAVQIRDARERTSVANQIEAIRQIGELVCLGSAFAVTNNLAAPLAASTLADVLFSSYQRLGAGRMKAKEESTMQLVLGKMREKEAKRQATEGGASPSATDGGAEKKEGGAGAASSETGGHTEGADAAGSQPPAAVGTGSAASETKKSEAEEDAATRR